MNRITKILNITFYTLLTTYVVLWFYKFNHLILMAKVHEFNLIALWVTTFEIGKHIALQFLFHNKIKLPKKAIGLLLTLIVLNIPVYLFNVEMQHDIHYTFKWADLVHMPFLMKKLALLATCLCMIVAIFIISTIIFQIQAYGKKGLLRVVKYFSLVIGAIALVLLINHYRVDALYLNFDEEPKTFADFRAHQNFKGKYVYVDFWHSGCSPCIKDFNNYKNFSSHLPQEIKEKVEFAYINVDRNTPGESERGRHLINKYDIDAHHYFISRAKFHKWWAELDPDATMDAAFSIYFLIDPAGNIIVRDGPKLGNDLTSLLMEKTTRN